MIRGVVIGLLVGIGAGWIVFSGASGPARSRTTVVVETPSPAKVDIQSPVTPADEPPADPRPVEDRLEIARKTRSWELFRDALAELGAMGPEGERKLVAIAGDETLRLQDHVGGLFWRALSKSEVDGIGAAALFRLRDAIDRGAWDDARGWLPLVAHRGTAAELDALVAMLDEDLRGFRRSIVQALTGSAGRPESAERLERLLVDDPEDLRPELLQSLRSLADINPPLAYRIARQRIGITSYSNIGPVAWALWRGAPEGQLGEAAGLLNGLTGDLERIYALSAVLRCGRTEDLTGLEPLLELPVTILERAARGERASATKPAYMLVRAHQRFSTRRTLAALETYLTVADSFDRSGIEETIERMKMHLGITSTEWDPER